MTLAARAPLVRLSYSWLYELNHNYPCTQTLWATEKLQSNADVDHCLVSWVLSCFAELMAFEQNINRVPVPPPSSGLDDIAEVAAGFQHVALRTRSGQVVLWAGPEFLSTSTDSESLAKLGDPATNVTQIASGSSIVIALTDRGEVLCSTSVVRVREGSIDGLCSPLRGVSDIRMALAGSARGNQTVRAVRAGANDWFFVQLNDVNGTWMLRNDGLEVDPSWLQGRPRPGNESETGGGNSKIGGEVENLIVLDNRGKFPRLILATFKGGGHALSIASDNFAQLPNWISDTAMASVCTVMGTNPRHVVVLLSNGSVAVWARGEVLPELQPPPGLGADEQGRATSLACGASHISVTLVNGQSQAWGANTRDGLLEPLGGGSVALTATTAGEFYSVYLSRSGNVYMAGTEEEAAPNTLPYALLTPTGLATQVAAGGECAVALLQGEGGVVAWGSASSGVSNVPPTIRNYEVVQVAAGERHALALLADGSVAAWGDVAEVKEKLPKVFMVAIAAGGRFGAAVAKDNAQLLVWGSFCDPQGWTLDQDRPTVVTGVSQISTSSNGVAVQLKDGSVLVNGCYGVLGYLLDQYTGNVSAVAVSDGGLVVLLLLKSGHVVALTAYEVPPLSANIPVAIQGHVERVSVGYGHAIALLRNGSVVAWGDDNYGQVSDIPPEVKAGKVLAISAGDGFTLAIVDPAVASSRPAQQLPPPGKSVDEAV
jgi:alpha-tubulin suppressor-like RCC1 family protein